MTQQMSCPSATKCVQHSHIIHSLVLGESACSRIRVPPIRYSKITSSSVGPFACLLKNNGWMDASQKRRRQCACLFTSATCMCLRGGEGFHPCLLDTTSQPTRTFNPRAYMLHMHMQQFVSVPKRSTGVRVDCFDRSLLLTIDTHTRCPRACPRIGDRLR